MRHRLGLTVRILAVLCLLACRAANVLAQDEGDLLARGRVFPNLGPGLRAVKRGADGNLYVLTAPAPQASVFDASGKLLKKVPSFSAGRGPASAELASIGFGEDLDIDDSGTVFVADRSANAVKIWEPSGSARLVRVPEPVSIAVLPEGEVAVGTLREPHLVIVFDKNGRDVREFGDPESLTERAELNRYLNIGQLATDALGHLYYAFAYLPEPTVRQYDRVGYARQDIQYTALEAMPAAQAARKEIERQERRGNQPSFRRIITAVGVDRANGEVWIALYNTLLHFDKEGNRRATYKIYTPEGARLEATTILIEPDRLVIGSDPLGIYEFARPDKKFQK
ncbi:MAG TPA: hypothetical protein VH110_05810 [Candidatus Acidoferrum sp.]|jgi:hypothetical protein|nr:hypothetical protein [Candidatus Acidoferrum sp.]